MLPPQLGKTKRSGKVSQRKGPLSESSKKKDGSHTRYGPGRCRGHCGTTVHIGLFIVVGPSDFWVLEFKMLLKEQKLRSTDSSLWNRKPGINGSIQAVAFIHQQLLVIPM